MTSFTCKKGRKVLLVPGFHVTHDASDAVITRSENRDRIAHSTREKTKPAETVALIERATHQTDGKY